MEVPSDLSVGDSPEALGLVRLWWWHSRSGCVLPWRWLANQPNRPVKRMLDVSNSL